MAKHTGEKSFICEYCGFSFKYESTLNVHKTTHHKECRYLCSSCPKSFPTEISLARHKDEEHVLIYDCDSCELKFPRRQNLMRHKKMKHCAKSPTLRCGDCDKSFRDSHDLRRHMEGVHQDKKEHVCKHCGKTFGIKNYLLKHLKSCPDEEEIDPLTAVTVVHEEPETAITSQISAVGRGDGEERDPLTTENEEEELTDSESPVKHTVTDNYADRESQFEHFVTEDPEDPFNYAATKILIDGIQKRYSMMAAIPKRPAVYREMAEELSMHGYKIPVHEIRKKWCNIVSYFWSLRNRPDSKDWEFFEQLSSFLEVDSQAPVTSSGDEFDHNSTTALIESVRKRYDALMHTVSRNRTTVYVDICEEVNSYGYNFDVQKLRRKWNNLLAQYKRVKKTTHATEVWEFFQQMNDFLDPGSSGPILIEGPSKKVQRIPLSPPASPGSPISSESETPSSSKKCIKVIPIKSEVAAIQSSKRDYRSIVPSAQPKRVISPTRPAPVHSKKSVVIPVPKADFLPHPLVIPNSGNISDNSSGRQENESNSHMNGVSKRLALLEEYIFSLTQKENEEKLYRINKERRSKIKLKLLAKMGRQLDIIAKTQSEILIKQDKILQSLDREVVDK